MSKRRDQIHKDKLSTDYKQRLDDERINAEDKQQYQESRADSADSMLPPRGENPALEELQAKRAEQAEQEQHGEEK